MLYVLGNQLPFLGVLTLGFDDIGLLLVLIDTIDIRTSAVLLDVDGTLLDLAETPLGVEVPQQLKRALEALAARSGGATSFVSGRSLARKSGRCTPRKSDLCGLIATEAASAAMFCNRCLLRVTTPTTRNRVVEWFCSSS